MNDTTEIRFWSKVNKTSDCWLWTGAANNKGYGRFYFRGSVISVHRASWEIHNGPIPEGMCVLHRCDVGLCIRPDHLFLGTQLQNVHDMDSKGRRNPPHLVGELNPACKLKAQDVQQIRGSKADGVTLAKQFGVSKQLISNIRLRLNWGHL